ncbi:MAG: CPBP family intramembrane metalloprotease [Verrucomicrobia bacterium]|nr:CPBP family intramembrane metalloprotease [Verrucomicrobiota bacterium]NBU11618.1 CPBP family intramembrane metalloprotease [Pseudomonadota bacterium]NDA67529.1 CPBP family intramembrane metalloprotease [Verrucomicrobiota bacterium]NDB75016.1 CPBP family intramembrane metalloprotease [Verrucomicrobiota bacterium]NDD37956.1 CPBP family intramembrane metalloprotease [Verrucomicrobiota bacterium]
MPLTEPAPDGQKPRGYVPPKEVEQPEYPGLVVSLILVFLVTDWAASMGMLSLLAISGWPAHYCEIVIKCAAFLMTGFICYNLHTAGDFFKYFALQRIRWQAAVRVPITYFGAILMFYGLRALVFQGLALIGIGRSDLSGPGSYANEPWLVSFFSGVVIAPLTEELVLRGIVLQGLLQRYAALPAVVISSAIFGLFHGNAQQAVAAFIGGCLLGYVFVQTRSLWVTILMHASHNALVVLFHAVLWGSDDADAKTFSFPVIPFSRTGWLWELAWVGAVLMVIIPVGWVLFHFSYRELRRQLLITDSATVTAPEGGLAPRLPLSDFKARRQSASSPGPQQNWMAL